MSARIFALVSSALLLATSPAFAREYFVSAGGEGKGLSKEAPAGRLDLILKGALRGDVIHVSQGEYYGRDLTGEFALNVPDLTLIGGYTADFSSRHPFKNPTVLRRKPGVKANYTQVLGGIVGCDPQAHAVGKKIDCSGLILDGFFLDGTTRNVYIGPGPRLGQGGSWKEPLLKLVTSDQHMTRDVKIRNCVFVNGYYQGIYVKWQGAGNEVSNCLFVNCSIAGIDATGAAQFPGGVEPELLVKNNTVACFYSHDKAQLAHGFKAGSKGKYRVQDNVFAYLSAPANGIAGGGEVSASGNVLWFTSDAEKVVRDQANAGVGGSDDEEEEEEEEEESAPAAPSGGNLNQDPGFACDAGFFDALTGFGILFNKFPAESMNEKRAELGMAPRKPGGNSGGPELRAYMRPYPQDWAKIPPAFVSKLAGKGIQLEGPFASYSERPCELLGATPGKKEEYQKVEWSDLSDKAKLKSLDGKKVKFKVGLNPRKERWNLEKQGVTPLDYVAFELRMPGKTSENLSEKIMGYAVLGTRAAERFNRYGGRKARKKSWKSGTWVRGVIYAKGMGKFPASIVVDYVGKVK